MGEFKVWSITVFLIAMLVLVLSASPNLQLWISKVKANPNWLSGWTYRKSHVINSQAGAGTNYQVTVTVHYGSGSDSGDDVYCNSHCKTDFGDIRFTDNDETTELDYWMETKTDSDSAVFWVEIADDLSSSSVTIYMYYGKADATTTSDGMDTFTFFDDFNRANNATVGEGWSELEAGGTASIESNKLKIVDTTSGGGKYAGAYHTYTFPSDEHAVGFNWSISNTGKDVYSFLYNSGMTTYSFFVSTYNPDHFQYYDGSYHEVQACADDVWYRFEYLVDSSATDYDIWVDNVEKNTGCNFANAVDPAIVRWSTGSTDSSYTVWVDWVYVRKLPTDYQSEPSHGAWGSEEEEGEEGVNSVTLNSPISSTQTSLSISFNFTPTFYQSIVNASVYTNETGNWLLEETNSSAIVNGSANIISHTLPSSAEGTVLWNVGVWNSTDEVFAASNVTFTLDIPPRYQNVNSNSTSIEEGGTIKLYGQGKDGIGLDWAWLATNETGNWKNYTTVDDSVASGFTYINQFEAGANQGVAFDGTYFYCTNDYTSHPNYTLYKLYKNGSQVMNRTECQLDGTDLTQINSIYYHTDGKLYVGANNYDTTPKKGYIQVYWANDLSYIEEHQVKDYWSEGCAYHENYWWVVYSDWDYVSKYNTSWVWQADYELTYSNSGTWGYQGILWIGDYIYVNLHNSANPVKCDVYYWNGTGFEETVRLDQPNAYCNQGICQDPTNSSVMWWAERHYSATCYITNSTINGVADGFYDSPIDMNDVADTWTWSNFTWSNSSITAGTTIQWRIYYNDTYGNVNGTGIHSFTVGNFAPTINQLRLSTTGSTENITTIDVFVWYDWEVNITDTDTLLDIYNLTIRIMNNPSQSIMDDTPDFNATKEYWFRYLNSTNAWEWYSGSTWTGTSDWLDTGNCAYPTKTGTNGWYLFRVKLNKIARKTVTWHFSALVFDSADNNANKNFTSITVNGYAEIIIVTTTHSWSDVQPDTQDNLVDEGSITVNVTCNYTFDLQAQSNSSHLVDAESHQILIGNVTIHKDTLGSSISLTTTWADILGLTSLPACNEVNSQYSFKLWLDVPGGTEAGNYQYKCEVRVTAT